MNTIHSGGVDYPLHYGMLELEKYEQLSNSPIGDLFSKFTEMSGGKQVNMPFSAKEMLDISFVGLQGGARKTKSGNEITREQAADILEDSDGGFVAVLQVFAQSLAKQFGGQAKTDETGNAPGPKGGKGKK